MRNSRQFWQDVNLAIYALMLRQSIYQIIVEGRNIRAEINKSIPTADRIRLLNRYHNVMMSRLQNHNGHLDD